MTKLYVAIFVEKNPYNQEKMDESNKKYMSKESTFALLGSAVILPMLGFFPYKFMNGIASMGQSFMHGEDPAHAVNYFSWVNIRGGLASLIIGAIVYFLIIRTCLMAKDENGNKVYINVWPAWLDLENLIYRPLMLVVLPTIGAFFCRICDKIFDTVAAIAPGVGAFVCRVLDGFVELFLWVDRKTIFRTKKVSDKIVEFAYLRGDTQVEGIQRQITGSLSFSLLLFCLGMCGALIYMLFVIG